jgi:hypothetical protein
MAIEIKELVVKFTVEQASNRNEVQNTSLSENKIKEIVNQCTEKVLDKLNRFEER